MRCIRFGHEFMPQESRLHEAEIFALWVIVLCDDLSGRKDGVSGLQRRGMTAGAVKDVAQRIVRHIGP